MTDAVSPPKAALWEDFLEIFYAPSRVFARRGGNDWGIPLLVLVVLTAIITFATWELLRPLGEADSARALAAQAIKQHWTPEQLEQNRAGFQKIGGFFKYIIIAATAIIPLLVGLFLWLVSKMVGAVESLGDALMISVYSYFPRLISGILMAIQAAVLPDEKLKGIASVTLGPARFMDPAKTSAGMAAMAGRLDLFIIWSTVLLVIGLRVKGKVSLGQAAIAGLVMWLLGSVQAIAALVRG
jgi:hypothetical protein